ncbi:methyl-accepting chemotaxis protein [Massilia endophytica]|uniref:methyl-accepting chemotaxis protein n=1 Tax=Massilia endophytica TaxID=2899220 RepID=UPI0022B23FB5|nr:methyl-accepting chemotaxis protein [Massilia endophytica]
MGIDQRLEQLLLWHKFAILSVVGIVVAVIPATLYMKETGKSLEALRLEAEARAPVATILKTIQTTQQHRGLAALVLGGVNEASSKREDKQRETDANYAAMSTIVAGLDDKRLDQAWGDAKRDWETLRDRVASRSISVPQSYEGHTALVPKLLEVTDQVTDHYGLNLDPDLDTYQLIQAIYYQLPYLSEELGKMRAKGAGLLATKTASTEDRLALSAIVARVADRLHQTLGQYNKAARANPALAAPLEAPVQDMRVQAEQTMKLAMDQIVKAETLSYSGPEYVKLTTAAIDAQYAFAGKATSQLNDMLDAKIATLTHARWWMLATLAGLFALGGLILYVIARSVTRPLHNAVEIAERVAAGDLTADIASDGRNETGRLLSSLGRMNDNLRNIVREVRVSVDTIGAATKDIASGNADLSARTESQASSLEETAASMEEITSTVKQNAENASQANQVATQASNVAQRGGKVVTDVVTTMEAINDSARKIVDIIGVIDGIAFQTNILALNAAVEAARAGEQGRGFAVVASEVRNLAQRSAAAAKEIKLLINESVERVDAGNRLVSQAGASMDEILSSVQRVSGIVSEIVIASQEQASGINQVNDAISHLDDTTQQNSALVEQAAAAAASLDEQAQNLVRTMSVFRVGDDEAAPAFRHRGSPHIRLAA